MFICTCTYGNVKLMKLIICNSLSETCFVSVILVLPVNIQYPENQLDHNNVLPCECNVFLLNDVHSISVNFFVFLNSFYIEE